MQSRQLAFLSVALLLVMGGHAVRPVSDLGVPSTTGLVVSASGIASGIGADILHRGGNAVDAAVATAFALAVTYPSAGNIGGGGFMIVREPSGEAIAFDYRERAPLKATETMYLDAEGKIDRSLTATGYLASAVPGTVRGLALAHGHFGKLAWRDVVTPAAELADRGFPLTAAVAGSLNAQIAGRMRQFPASVDAYGKPAGAQWAAGDVIVLKDLASTLRAIASNGPDAFYKGWIADRIDAAMKANGGLITRADLAAYQPKVRTPIRGTFCGYEIVSMPPPSSGGVAVVEMLNILEHFDLSAHPRYAPETLHLLIESMRRAYLDRARHLGDPDFVQVPVDRLTSKAYARELARGIDPTKASSSVALGEDIVRAATGEGENTTHFSVLDKDGMAVANTYTLNDLYGSGVAVEGAGFLLNNIMDDFNKKRGETNLDGDIGTPPNLIAPAKRMLSSMTPTIVSKDGRLVLITGSPGGRTIMNTVLNVVLNVTAFGMTGREAVDAARLHHQWLPDRATFEADAVSEDVLARLRAMGHEIAVRDRQGDAHSIWIDPKTGVAYGVNDRRSPDSKAAR